MFSQPEISNIEYECLYQFRYSPSKKGYKQSTFQGNPRIMELMDWLIKGEDPNGKYH
jgi:hypothetical protein